jgi:hypothetical protein
VTTFDPVTRIDDGFEMHIKGDLKIWGDVLHDFTTRDLHFLFAVIHSGLQSAPSVFRSCAKVKVLGRCRPTLLLATLIIEKEFDSRECNQSAYV